MRKSDEELLDGFNKGNRGCFDVLVRRYKDRMFQYMRWQCGADQAEDAAQEAFVQLFYSAGRFEGRSSFRTWFYAIARNVCHDIHRRGTMRLVDIDVVDQEIDDALPNAQTVLERAETHADVRRAVEQLPPLYCEVLVLREWEEMTYGEIAEVLEIPVGTVRSRIHNARQALARALTLLPSGSDQ